MSARAAAAVLAAMLSGTARAEPPPLRHDPAVDGALTAGAAVLWLSSELAKGKLAPSSCRWCAENRVDASARDLLVWSNAERAARLSDVLAFGLVPAGMAAHQLLAARAAGDAKEGLVDVLVVAEAAALAMDLNQIVKLSAGRQRPFVHHGNWRDPDRTPQPDDNLSFYSGHSTLAFSLAAAAGTVSDLRGYGSARWVWAAGMTLAATTAYLRVAGDMHYLTDVLAGAALGTAAGVALPRLLHPRKDGAGAATGAVTAVPLGIVVVF
ncbi:MAG TPA: phosphatase PAP2 family protein [Anaeromyxobacter sp.]